MSSDITKRIEENSYTVGVIGLGYVGIPLSLGFAGKGIRVIGFDTVSYTHLTLPTKAKV